MTSVTQKIPNFVGGISQQPDELINTGSVKDLVNGLPDIKGILSKRPGSKLISTLSSQVEGKWHHYFRDNNEQYFMRVRRNGQVDVWDALSGTPRVVTYSSEPVEVGTMQTTAASDDADPICTACNISDFQTKQQDLQTAEIALEKQAVAIEKIDIQLTDTTLTPAERTALETQKTTLEAQIPGLIVTYNTALAAFGPVAENCGVFAAGHSTDSAPSCTPTVLPNYLVHEADEDLQLTTVNDYTFVTNRKRTVNMDSGSIPGSGNIDYPYEAFLYLNELQADQVYSVRWWDEDETVTTTTYKQAASLSLRQTNQTDSTAYGAATQVINDTDPVSGITYRLTVERTDVLESEPDNNDAYDGAWEARVQLIATDPSKDSGVTTADIVLSVLGKTWRIYVDSERTYTTTADYTITAGPYVTGTDVLNAETILQDLVGTQATNGFLGINEATDDPATTVDETSLVEAEIIGNGIFLRSREPFVIDTPDTQLITVINGEVNSPTLLPTQCKDGYVVKITNSFVEEDDYYVKFVSKIPSTNGAGVWEETVAPGVLTRFDYTTMPHQIRRLSNGTFEVSPIVWARREVGDNVTNPKPSFVGNSINKTMFFRNRFVFLSGESVIMSRPNEYFNVWANTAQTLTDGDPIDVLAASTFPSILYDGVSTSAGLLVFSANQQFLVVTDTTDVFSPRTVMVKNVGQYKYNTKVRPVQMGQTVGFLNDAGYRSRYFELIPSRDYDYDAFETSKPVDQLVPSGLNLIADSKDDNIVALAYKQPTTGTVAEGAENPTLTFEDDARFVWMYRYFKQGERRIQSSWFKWKLSGNILYHAIMDDKYYAVLAIATGDTTTPYVVTLQSFDLRIDRQSYLVQVTGDDMREYDYQVHLDNYTMIIPSQMTYDATADETTWRLPLGFNGPETVVAYELELQADEGYNASGRYTELTTAYVNNGIEATAPGNWTDSHVICGYNFEFLVQFPTLFVTKRSNQVIESDTSASLVLHRCKFNFDTTGVCDFTVERKGRDPYTVLIESTFEDGYAADHPAVDTNVAHTIPIYDKNTNVDIYLKSKYPTPTNLVSMSWEGDYNPLYYKRA